MSDKDEARAELEHLRAIAKRLRIADNELSNAAIDFAHSGHDIFSAHAWRISDRLSILLLKVNTRMSELDEDWCP